MINKFKVLIDYFTSRILTEKEMDTLLLSADNGDIEAIDSVLKNNKIRFFKPLINEIFSRACKNNHLNLVEYLLTSDNTKDFHEIHLKDSKGMILAAQRDYSDIVKFLLHSTKLSKHADIHADNDILLITAYNAERTELVKYLILDCNIEKTPAIQEKIDEVKLKEPTSYIQEKQYNFILEIEKMFNITSVNRDLNRELPVNNEKKQKKLKL